MFALFLLSYYLSYFLSAVDVPRSVNTPRLPEQIEHTTEEYCAMKEITIFQKNTHFPPTESYQQCLRASDDLISRRIRKTGRWIDCLAVVTLWNRYISKIPLINDQGRNLIFLDVGGNIGSCSLAMLSYGIPVIAFEPLPSNLFYFKESVLANEGFKELTSLSDVAIGAEIGSTTLYPYASNQGMASIGKLTGDIHKSHIDGQHGIEVQVNTLDNLLWSSNMSTPRVGIMKLDVEGFEEHALRGGNKLLNSGAISIIQFEVTPEMIVAAHSSVEKIVDVIQEAGYTIHFFHPSDYERQSHMTFKRSNVVSKGKLISMTQARDWDFFAVHSSLWPQTKKYIGE